MKKIIQRVIIWLTLIASVFILILIYFVFTGEIKLFWNKGEISYNKSIIVEREYSKLVIDFPAMYILKESNDNKIQLKGFENVFKFLEIKQTSKTLSLLKKKDLNLYHIGWNIDFERQNTITIYIPKIQELEIYNETQVIINNLQTNNLNILFNSTKSLESDNFFVENLNLKITSKIGFINLYGKVENNLNIDCQNQTSIFLKNLPTKNISANLNCSSIPEVYALENLKVIFDTKTQLKYKGNPKIIVEKGDLKDVIRI